VESQTLEMVTHFTWMKGPLPSSPILMVMASGIPACKTGQAPGRNGTQGWQPGRMSRVDQTVYVGARASRQASVVGFLGRSRRLPFSPTAKRLEPPSSSPGVALNWGPPPSMPALDKGPGERESSPHSLGKCSLPRSISRL